ERPVVELPSTPSVPPSPASPAGERSGKGVRPSLTSASEHADALSAAANALAMAIVARVGREATGALGTASGEDAGSGARALVRAAAEPRQVDAIELEQIDVEVGQVPVLAGVGDVPRRHAEDVLTEPHLAPDVLARDEERNVRRVVGAAVGHVAPQ